MSEELSVSNLMKEFKACADVKHEYFQIANEKVQIFYCDGMADEVLLFKTILPELRKQLTNSLTQEGTSQQQTDGQKNTANTESNSSENVKSNKHAHENNSVDNSDGAKSQGESGKQQKNKKNSLQLTDGGANNNNQNSLAQNNSSQDVQNSLESNQEESSKNSVGKDTNSNTLDTSDNNQEESSKKSVGKDTNSNTLDTSDSNQGESAKDSVGKETNNSTQNVSDASAGAVTSSSKEQANNSLNASPKNASNRFNPPMNKDEGKKNNESATNTNFQIEDFMLPGLKQIDKLEDAMEQVFRGNCVIALKEYELFLVVQTANQPNRQPEETKLETMVKGPRDNFVEDTITNIALVRKRLPTSSLAVEKLIVGERSKTNVAILYFQDIADEKILKEMKQELQEINTDVIFSGELLMEEVSKKMLAIPRYEYTGRPDFVVQALARGRFVVFVEGSAYAMLTPVSFMFLLKSGEDNEYPILYSSFQRLLRITGLIIGLLLPAFWLALTTFHQNQLPLHLLATVVQANTGLPLPSALEMLIMLLFFELFREAGLRLPSVIGGTISVVGGLIIGDAAIRAGITSPAMVVVIALSTIATFTLINQSVVGLVSLLRITFIGVTALFGLYGFFTSVFLTIFFLAHIKVFGVPYVNVAADLNFKNFLKTFLRLNHQEYKKRPEALKTKDDTRTKSNDKPD